MKTLLTGLFTLFFGIAFGQSPVIEAEYYFNEDPGYGEATAISLTEGFDISISELISNDLPLGLHTITLRPLNDAGQWGIEQTIPFLHYAEPTTGYTAATVVVGYEYYFGDDPGVGEAIYVSVTENAEVIIQAWLSSLGLSDGNYTLSMRPKGDNDIWGLSDWVEFEFLECEENEVAIEGPSEFCEGSGVVLTAPEGYNSWNWNTLDQTEVITIYESGEFNVTVYDEINYQCFHSNTLDIEMVLAQNPLFDIDQSFNEATFTATLPGQTLTWEIDGEEVGSEDSIDFTFDTDGEHTVCLEVTNVCGVFETCEIIVVCSEFEVPPFFYPDLDEDGFGTATDSLQACEAPVGYADNASDCDDTNDEINPDAIEIENDGIDQNCDGNDFSTGLIELTASDFKVYPNPTHGMLNVAFTEGFSGDACIYDMRGKLVHQSKLYDAKEVQFDTASFQSGIYILRLFNEKQQALSRISIL